MRLVVVSADFPQGWVISRHSCDYRKFTDTVAIIAINVMAIDGTEVRGRASSARSCDERS